MALTDEGGNGFNVSMPVAPAAYGYGYPMMGGGFGGNGGFGDGNWSWIIVLFLFAMFGGWGNGGFGGGFGGGLGYDFPWLLNGQNGINNNVSDGFRDAQLHDSVTSVRDGVSNLATQLCGSTGDIQMALSNGFAGTTAAITGAQNAVTQQMYTNQIADLERSFAAQTASTAGMNALQSQLANCCCENRAGIADLRYTVATEACADRAAVSDALRDVIAANTASTQRILDQLCADKIEQKNDTIAQLRQELMFARGQASQDVQTAQIQAGQRALANEVEQYVLPTPRPAYVVANPNCCQPNFGCGCGCGG